MNPCLAPTSRAFAVALVVLAVSCSDPLGAGTEWIVGSWRWVFSRPEQGPTIPVPAPDALVLTLRADGTAMVREYNTLRESAFRAERRIIGRVAIIELHFDGTVGEGSHYWALPGPSDTLSLSLPPSGAICDDGCSLTLVFTRVP
jgi:hypothetical protein